MLKKIKKLSKKEWNLFFKAIFWTGIACGLIMCFKLKKFSFLLGKHMEETVHRSSGDNMELLSAVGLAIRRASRVVPWRCKCYEQGIAAKIILRKYGIETTFYYGVAKDKDEKLIAHAWVRSGEYIVTGKKGMKRFTVVGTFA
jgi:hypothetical protein